MKNKDEIATKNVVTTIKRKPAEVVKNQDDEIADRIEELRKLVTGKVIDNEGDE